MRMMMIEQPQEDRVVRTDDAFILNQVCLAGNQER
jgi:hypothetical protein